MPSPLGSGSEAVALTLASDMKNVVARLPESGKLELELPPRSAMPSPLGSGSEAAALTLASDMENEVARLQESTGLQLEL